MENAADQNKKGMFEDMSKDELIKKCKGYLTIAQKAKSAKDSLVEENNALKAQLQKVDVKVQDASQELIDNLTQQKLTLITSIEELKQKNQHLENNLKQYEDSAQKLDQYETENVALKRQNVRLTKENEQLLTDLESLEKQIEQLKQLGMVQQTQLLELEKNKTLIEEKGIVDAKMSELQSMLSISLEEIKKLHAENKVALEKVDNLKLNLSEKDNNILTISKELQTKCDIVKALTEELNTLKEYKVETSNIVESYNKLKLEYTELTESIKSKDSVNLTDSDNLQELNNKLKEKVKLYHSKLVKFAGQVKALKTDKKDILNLFMKYTNQVKIWQEQLNIVATKLVEVETALLQEKEEASKENMRLSSELEKLQVTYNESKKQHETELKNEKEMFNRKLKEYQDLIKSNQEKPDISEDALTELKVSHEKLESEKQTLTSELEKLKDGNKKIQEVNLNEISQLKEVIQSLELELEHSKQTETQLAEKSSEEILKLVQENKDLLSTNTRIQEELDIINRIRSQNQDQETQTDAEPLPSNEYEEQIQHLKRENSELLREMNEMNQVLKERGESISKLEAHCEEILKKLQVYETQANKNVDNISQKDELIQKLTKEIEDLKNNGNSSPESDTVSALKNEIEHLKEKVNANMDTSYAESETMSTSTISRTDEANRLKDLEGSWEERYGKLRNLALKLKGRVRELTGVVAKEQQEKEELQQKLAQNMKTIQTLQNQIDDLQDKLEINKKQANQYAERLNSIATDISKDKQQLVRNEETISKLRQEIEQHKTEKQTTEQWKLEVSAKVKTLRKEIEANTLLKKDFEARIAKLNSDLEAKEVQLKNEIESHRQTKNQLDQSNNECRKNSVLNLEMQDYERSVKDLSQKIDKKQEQITKLKSQVETQKSTISALREQNKILEEKVQNEESTLSSASTEILSYKKKISELENLVQQKEEKVHSVTDLLESSRSENEELATELSKVIAEHQKAANAAKNEKDHLRSQLLGLQQSLRQTQDSLKLKEDELKSTNAEYESYKVRAQSVLRQNQNRDVGLEEKLSEEVTTLKSQNDFLNSQLKELT